ncbi:MULTISPECIES: glycosyltransferase [unclassified Micromonospora]|uniref:glycosyltransferase n=1 Tax=unclassified Micromonospora TaxID=2617518 RepID=UPI001C227967|nr:MULTISPECIES: glycosyltransferase [unclassified Micromonospora]MBU8857843.1 glycosyl transferase family 28 [Micromonospora sp. WMMB482]MDM4783474.1 glycosyltransferase [Micromonospora sp. b486]
MIPRQRDRRAAAPYVLVVVGTDVHRFDRLVGWLERWHAARTGVRLVLQYGHSRTPALPEATPFLGHEELQRAMAEATLVVSHGGPATITEARRNGHLPIVVPRDPSHDEHVDNHQQLFSRRLGAAGMVRLCESETELLAALDEGLADPSRFVLAADPGRPDPRAEAVARVGAVIDELVARRVRQRAVGRRG